MAESKTKTLANSGAVPSADNHAIQQRDNENKDGEDGGAAAAAEQQATDDRLSSVPGPGALVDNKYRIDRLIARGGMGVVYAATHTVSGKKVALKWMLPALGQIQGARERFLQEACATARIAHPNIVDIYDVGSESGCAYLVMEYLRGETLADRMCRERLAVTDAVALLMPALRGVASAHTHGVIHRDLKPENIFLCRTEYGEELEPKVLDFGISKITTDEVQSLALTHTGAVLGTPYYMSPEQVRGARDVDERADVYAFGVILFEALTGERPFDAETYNELILKIATEPLPNAAALNPELDPRLVAVIERAMARDPQSRFGDIKQLALALEPFSGGVRFRSMQTLSQRPETSGDAPVAALEPLPPEAAPEREPPIPTVTLPATPVRRGARVAISGAFLGLLACAAFATYSLRNPAANATEPKANATTAKAPRADDTDHTDHPAKPAQAASLSPAPHDPPTHEPPTREPPTRDPQTNDTNAATAFDTHPLAEHSSQPDARDRTTPDTATAAAELSTSQPPEQPDRLDPKSQSNPQRTAASTPRPNPVPGTTPTRAQPMRANALARKWASQNTGTRRNLRARHRTLAATPPEPEQTTPAPVVVRALPSDWDRVLDDKQAAPATAHIPAGPMNISDF